MKAIIKKNNNEVTNKFEIQMPSSRVDYRDWDGEKPKDNHGREFDGLFYDVRDIVFNYNKQEDVFPPYLTHYMDSAGKGAGKVKDIGNIRGTSRYKCEIHLLHENLCACPAARLFSPPNPTLMCNCQHRHSKIMQS